MKNILFSTDFSDDSISVLKNADLLFKDKDVRIDAIHVFNIPIGLASSIPPMMMDKVIDQKKSFILKQMVDLDKQLVHHKFSKKIIIHGMYPSSEIADVAKAYDIVVMGLKTHYSWYDRMLGGITAHLIDKSTAPILIVPAKCQRSEINKVVYAASFDAPNNISENEKRIIQQAKNYAELFGAKIQYLHVEEGENVNQIDIEFANIDGIIENLDIVYAPRILDGLNRYITKQEPDLVVFHRPHRQLIKSLFHKSVINSYIYEACLPILVLQ